jgi:3-hydroxyacyl-[acyl-carrier-protein] dehydratase
VPKPTSRTIIPERSQRYRATIEIARDHPAFPGHFPGDPVVPGVLLLDKVIEAAEAWRGRSLRVVGLQRTKFVARLLPGEAATIELSLDGQYLEFIIDREGTTIATGRLDVDRTDEP